MSDFLIPFRLLPHIVLFNKNHVCDFVEKASIFYLLSKIIIEISFSTITSQKSRQVLLKKGKKKNKQKLEKYTDSAICSYNSVWAASGKKTVPIQMTGEKCMPL